MTNGVVLGRHLESLAGAAKQFTLSKLGGLSGATYEVFTGAGASSAGLSGLVPAPQATDSGKFLCSDGTWSEVIVINIADEPEHFTEDDLDDIFN